MPGPLQELTAQCSFSFLFHKQILFFVSQTFKSRSSCLRHIFTLGPDYQCVKRYNKPAHTRHSPDSLVMYSFLCFLDSVIAVLAICG